MGIARRLGRSWTSWAHLEGIRMHYLFPLSISRKSGNSRELTRTKSGTWQFGIHLMSIAWADWVVTGCYSHAQLRNWVPVRWSVQGQYGKTFKDKKKTNLWFQNHYWKLRRVVGDVHPFHSDDSIEICDSLMPFGWVGWVVSVTFIFPGIFLSVWCRCVFFFFIFVFFIFHSVCYRNCHS